MIFELRLIRKKIEKRPPTVVPAKSDSDILYILFTIVK